jgi:hypothetical protein
MADAGTTLEDEQASEWLTVAQPLEDRVCISKTTASFVFPRHSSATADNDDRRARCLGASQPELHRTAALAPQQLQHASPSPPRAATSSDELLMMIYLFACMSMRSQN